MYLLTFCNSVIIYISAPNLYDFLPWNTNGPYNWSIQLLHYISCLLKLKIYTISPKSHLSFCTFKPFDSRCLIPGFTEIKYTYLNLIISSFFNINLNKLTKCYSLNSEDFWNIVLSYNFSLNTVKAPTPHCCTVSISICRIFSWITDPAAAAAVCLLLETSQ